MVAKSASRSKNILTRWRFIVPVVILVAVVGVSIQHFSHAATAVVMSEVEATGGTFTGVTTISDTTASAGKAVRFGSATPPPPPPPAGSYTMGTSKGDDVHDGYPNWDAVRVYKFGSVEKPISAGAEIIALTDSGISITGGLSSANALDTQLGAFFQKHPNIEVHWGSGNEVDRDITSSNAASYVNTLKLMRPVIDKYQSQGRKVSMWVDLTQNNIKQSSDYEALFMEGAAPYLDGLAASMYPPGTDMADFPGFLDKIFATAKHWNLKRIDMWEGGAKVEPDTSRKSIALTDVNGVRTTYNVSSYKQIRPLWSAYYAKYVVDSGVKNNIAVEAICWWDGDVPGRETFFNHDPTGTSPRTVEVWRNWSSWIGKAQ